MRNTVRRHPSPGLAATGPGRATSVSVAPHRVADMTAIELIEPFELHVADEVLDDLRARLARTRLLPTRRGSRRRA